MPADRATLEQAIHYSAAVADELTGEEVARRGLADVPSAFGSAYAGGRARILFQGDSAKIGHQIVGVIFSRCDREC